MNPLITQHFAMVDVVLRRGGNINRSNYQAYEYVRENQEVIGNFYAQFGATLRHHPEGCYFLIGTESLFDTALLKRSCLHLGLFILYKSREETATRTAGWLSTHQLINELESFVPLKTLRKVYAPKCKEMNFKSKFQEAFDDALDTLAILMFVEVSNEMVRAHEAIRRFADPFRTENSDEDARRLQLLLNSGIVFDQKEDDDE